MTGPERYSEGEHLLACCNDHSLYDESELRHALAAEAQAHFLAALVATTAAHQHPESVAWAKVIDP